MFDQSAIALFHKTTLVITLAVIVTAVHYAVKWLKNKREEDFINMMRGFVYGLSCIVTACVMRLAGL